ncbi:MAG: FecR family protein [Dysgonomonas sp.]
MEIKLLHKFFEGQASRSEEEIIRRWVDASPENEKLLLKERVSFDKLLLHNQLGEFTEDETEESDSSVKRVRVSLYFKELVKIAAVVGITLLSVALLSKPVQQEEEVFATQTISVPSGQRLNLTLPDGTNVWLNAKTTIKYPVSFNKKERSVFLDGQAYFDVAKNKEIPFVVKTKDGMVRALGTKFDVMAYSDNSSFETVLMEGKVKVESMKDSTQKVILTPNSKVYLKDGLLQAVHVDDFSAYAWKDGLISFKNESFGDIMKSFEKVYDIRIVIRNPKIANLIYTGKFRVIDGVDYALRVLQRDVKFRYERDTEKHIVYIR